MMRMQLHNKNKMRKRRVEIWVPLWTVYGQIERGGVSNQKARQAFTKIRSSRSLFVKRHPTRLLNGV